MKLINLYAGGGDMNKEDRLIMGVRDLYNKMNFLNKFKMEDTLKGHTSSEVHCIEYIGRTTDTNVTKLAESFYMTRGAISKMTKKLIKKGMIESYQKPENKKEIYFKLTGKGAEVYHIHEGLHDEFRERDKTVFEHITEKQYEDMLRLVENYNRHLDVEIKKQGAQKIFDQ